MAEKSRWGLGAKLRGLFGGSSSKNTSSEEQEVTPEVIEDVTVDLAIAPTDTVATVESETIATEQLEVVDAPEPEPEPESKPQPQPQPEPATVQAPVEEHEYIAEPTSEQTPVHVHVHVPVPESALAAPAEPVVEKKPKPVNAEAPKVTIKPSRKATITEETWEELEEMLLGADFGPDITEELIDTMRANIAKYQTTDSDDFVRMLREAIE